MSKATEKSDMDPELGTLIVVLLKARNLNDKHSFWKQDVFAQATLNGVQKRSHVDIKGGQHPEWDSEVRFTVLKGNGPGAKNRKLEVACYSQESKSEDLLGQATVNISETLKTGEFDDWVSLDVGGVVRGDIYLEMTYYAKAPAPAATPNNKFIASVQGSAFSRRPSKFDRLSRPIQPITAGPSRFSPKQPSRLHNQSNSTSPHLNNAVSPISKNGALSSLLSDEPVYASPTLSNPRDLRSPSPPQGASSQLAELPSILRPGLGGRSAPISVSDPRDFGRNRSPSSFSSNNRPHSMTPGDTSVHSGLSNTSGYLPSNPSGAYIPGQQHRQASGGRPSSPAPPGAWPNGQSHSPASRVQTSGPSNLDGAVCPNLYTFIPGGQHQQASAGQAYSPPPFTVPVQNFGSSHLNIPISVPPPNQYAGNGLPENQLGPNIPSYSPTSPVSIQTSGLSNIDHGRRCSAASPVDIAQNSGYTSYATSLQVASGPSLSYNAGAGVSTVSSGSPAFPMPVIPVVQPYGYHEPSYMRPGVDGRCESSSYYQPPLSPPPRPSLGSNNWSAPEQALDPYHLARYKTPLPLPPGSVKSPLPPPPPPPAQVYSPPPAVPLPALNTSRVEALRKIEQDAAWRKEQERKDMELAMKLDLEFNVV